MTGFGMASVEYQQKIITVEIRSVNSKFFDLNLRLPAAYKDKEMAVRSELARFVERGKTEVSFLVESQDGMRRAVINVPMVKAYHEELSRISAELGVSATDRLNAILSLPEVLLTEKQVLTDEEWKSASSALSKALKKFEEFRATEGKVIEDDMTMRIKSISSSIGKLAEFEAGRIETVRKRLESSLEEFIQVNNIDRNRLEQELIFYVEKFDISEEKLRLKSHCDYFLATIKEGNSMGKKLAFITQEIGREINTIGSKANEANMQRLVVEMKDELEKVKEQVLNVL